MKLFRIEAYLKNGDPRPHVGYKKTREEAKQFAKDQRGRRVYARVRFLEVKD